MPFFAANKRKTKLASPGDELRLNFKKTNVGVLAVDKSSPNKIHITLTRKNLGVSLDKGKTFVSDRVIDSKSFSIHYINSKKVALRVDYVPEEDEISLGE